MHNPLSCNEKWLKGFHQKWLIFPPRILLWSQKGRLWNSLKMRLGLSKVLKLIWLDRYRTFYHVNENFDRTGCVNGPQCDITRQHFQFCKKPTRQTFNVGAWSSSQVLKFFPGFWSFYPFYPSWNTMYTSVHPISTTDSLF